MMSSTLDEAAPAGIFKHRQHRQHRQHHQLTSFDIEQEEEEEDNPLVAEGDIFQERNRKRILAARQNWVVGIAVLVSLLIAIMSVTVSNHETDDILDALAAAPDYEVASSSAPTDPPMSHPGTQSTSIPPTTSPTSEWPPPQANQPALPYTGTPIFSPPPVPLMACEVEYTDTGTGTGDGTWDGYLDEVLNMDGVNSQGGKIISPARCEPMVQVNNNNARCECRNPLVPVMPMTPDWWRIGWQKAEQRNLALVQNTTQPLDVVLFGDSITEHWLGTDLGTLEPQWQRHNALYRQLFSKKTGATIEGLALGIAGDRCRHLLRRIMNGELADHIQPSVFWILIGTNDLDGDKCSKDQIAAGTIRIVKEILERRPTATVVVNSILPHAYKTERDWMKWDIVLRPVNQCLECFAASTDRVEFFNATRLFLNQTSIERSPNMTLFAGLWRGPGGPFDTVHPSALGSRVWGDAIVDRVREITARSRNYR